MFKSSYDSCFSDCACCPTCKAPLVYHASFCPGCGTSLEGMPQSKLAWEPPDKPKYCVDCGNILNANGDCLNCNPAESLSKNINDLFGTDIGGKIKKTGFIVLVAIVLFLPSFCSSWPGRLISDSVQPNNNYVNKLNEWTTSPSLANDPDWLAGFDDASGVLVDVNTRLFQVKADRLSYRDLYTYVQYAEASYRQIAVMQTIGDSVHKGNDSEAPALLTLFDKTIDQQLNALAQGIKLSNDSKLKAAENLALDSIRFYLSFIPTLILSCVLFIVAMCGLTAGVILLIKHRINDLFIHKEEDLTTDEEKKARERRYRQYRKGERTAALIGIGIAVVLIGVSPALAAKTNVQHEPKFADCVHAAYTSDGTEIVSWLSNCETDPKTAKANCNRISNVIRDCQENLSVVIGSEEADKELILVSSNLKDALASLEKELNTGTLPDRHTTKTITELMIKGMEKDVRLLLKNAIETFAD